jgi:hypothetical protein
MSATSFRGPVRVPISDKGYLDFGEHLARLHSLNGTNVTAMSRFYVRVPSHHTLIRICVWRIQSRQTDSASNSLETRAPVPTTMKTSTPSRILRRCSAMIF